MASVTEYPTSSKNGEQAVNRNGSLERNKRGCDKRGCKSKIVERNKLDQICAKLAGFARNLPNVLVIKGM